VTGRGPHEAVCGIPVVDGGRRAGQSLDGIGETAQFARMTLLNVFGHCVSSFECSLCAISLFEAG
jgi:hypothetical protein